MTDDPAALRDRIDRLERRLARERATRRESEAIAEAAMLRLYENDRLKTVFLGTVSHELRTPLTSISGFTSMLLDFWDRLTEEERRDFIRRVDRNAHDLREMIDELLDFTRLQRGKLEVDLHRRDLAELVSEALRDTGPSVDTHQIVEDMTPAVTVLADDHAIRRVVVNLLTNAVRYSPAGTKVVVRVLASPPRIVVDDEGPGVPADERDAIFEPFYRGQGPGILETRGTGIGLSIVRELLDMHEGSIEVGDSPAGGARFVATLPEPSRPER